MSLFNTWVDGRPWWVTLLLLPALVMAAAAGRVARYALAAGAMALVVLVAALAWRALRRR